MSFAKGPMEGHGSAKREVLARDPGARCEAVCGQDGRVAGYLVILGDGRKEGARSARDAWRAALERLIGNER